MSTSTETTTWVARGGAGTVGTIHRHDGGYLVRVARADDDRGPFESLEVAKRALHAALGPGADRPEFIGH